MRPFIQLASAALAGALVGSRYEFIDLAENVAPRQTPRHRAARGADPYAAPFISEAAARRAQRRLERAERKGPHIPAHIKRNASVATRQYGAYVATEVKAA